MTTNINSLPTNTEKPTYQELVVALDYAAGEILAFYQAAQHGEIDAVITIGQWGRQKKLRELVTRAREI